MRYAFMEESVIVTVIDEEGLPDYVLGRKQIYIPDSGEGVGNIRLSWLEGKVAGYPGQRRLQRMVAGNLLLRLAHEN